MAASFVIHSEDEIRRIKIAAAATARVRDEVAKRACPGMSTLELDEIAAALIAQENGRSAFLGYGGFPASACVSVNEMVVHGIPDEETILKDGDIVSVDLCAYKNGYHGDAARTFCIGEVSPEKKQLVKVTEECFFKAIEGLKAGTPLFDIGYRVQKHAESFGYGVIRSYTGHAIGKEMHEDPSVPNFGKLGTGMRLKAGMVLCIEPMIALGSWKVRILSDDWTAVTQDGKPAAHYENTVVVREDGVEILTL